MKDFEAVFGLAALTLVFLILGAVAVTLVL